MNNLNKIPFIRSTRRNHALEHATMKVLAERFKGVKMMGHSNPGGFLLFADLPTDWSLTQFWKRENACRLANPNWQSIQVAVRISLHLPYWQVQLLLSS